MKEDSLIGGSLERASFSFSGGRPKLDICIRRFLEVLAFRRYNYEEVSARYPIIHSLYSILAFLVLLE